MSVHLAPSPFLAELTTLRVGGPANRVVTVSSEAELIECVRDADARGEPLLLVGGGSNLLVSDDGFDGMAVRIATSGIELTEESFCSGVDVTVAAGENWDGLVARTVAEGWVGLEALSGIPGLTGATPIQNVGAYGAEVAQTMSVARTWDRQENRVRSFFASDCGFGYRTSMFKRAPGRYVVLDVTFQLPLGDYSAPIGYPELASALGVALGTRVPAADVRAAVLSLRAGKGMVLDPDDHDTWSAGSFFTNPVLAAADIPAGAPAFPQPDGRVKTSAAWLIEHAGYGRGYGRGPAGLSTKHTLAMTNRGGASCADLIGLAREIRAGVQQAYGIILEPEPVLVGCSL